MCSFTKLRARSSICPSLDMKLAHGHRVFGGFLVGLRKQLQQRRRPGREEQVEGHKNKQSKDLTIRAWQDQRNG